MSLSKTTSTPKGTTSAKIENRLAKTRVYLEYTCFVCGAVQTRANITISHIKRLHGYDIPTHSVGRKRPQSREFEYVDSKNVPHDTDEYACPSCWFHCPIGVLEDLNIHTRTEHDVIKVDDTKKKKEWNDYVPNASGKGPDSRCLIKHNTVGTQSALVPVKADDDTTTAEIATKLEELADLFKNFFK